MNGSHAMIGAATEVTGVIEVIEVTAREVVIDDVHDHLDLGARVHLGAMVK